MVALFGLPALVGVMVVLGLLAAVSPSLPGRAIAPATAGLCLLALLLGLAMVAAGGRSLLLGGMVAIDPLAAFFLLLPAFAGLATAMGRMGQSLSGMLPGFVAACFLVILAGDCRTVLLGIALFTLAGSGWWLRPSSVAGVFLLAGGFTVLSMGVGPAFALIRAAPPDGWRAGAVIALTLCGLAPLVGWAPWHRPILAARDPAVPFASTAPLIGLYLAIRILADLCGPATPGWWGLPVLLLGAISAGAGLVAALAPATFGAVLDGLAIQQGGWMLTGLGVAVVARSADVPSLATLALGGAMLHALTYSVAASLVALSTETAAAGAGSATLDRLGGLAGRMPAAALGVLAGGLSLAFLPPSAGFASGWMLLQALFAAPRLGGLSLQLVVAAVVGALALSSGFGAVAIVRMGGIAFLGRPRTPRAAAADDASAAQRATLLGLTGLCCLLGVFPGIALQLTAPAQRLVTAAGLDGQGGWAGVRTQLDSPGYAPLAIVVLLVVALALVAVLSRRGVLPTAEGVAAWEDGFAASPPWLPFGDPATQATAAAFTASLPAVPAIQSPLPRIKLRVDVSALPIGPRLVAVTILVATVALLLIVATLGPA